MSFIVKQIVRIRLALTGRDKASAQIRMEGDRYLALAETLDADSGALPVRVPAMMGVDEDMRDWSFFMLLEHHVIVNRGITLMVDSLARGVEIDPAAAVDPKHDVMPSASPGAEQIEAFRSSIDDHLNTVASLGRLRGSARKPHSLFGNFDAHCWHCMFGMHLSIHYKQAQLIAREAPAKG